jgi:hypothetical protein
LINVSVNYDGFVIINSKSIKAIQIHDYLYVGAYLQVMIKGEMQGESIGAKRM